MNKLICSLTGQQYRAAFLCKASDLRRNLNSIHLNAEHNEVVATNGEVLYCANLRPGEAMESVTFTPAKIAANVETIDVLANDDKSVLLKCLDRNGNVSQFICQRIEAIYPNYKAIFSERPDKQFNAISYDPKYLALLGRIFGKYPVTLHIPDNAGASQVTSPSNPDFGTVILMPIKQKA